ncbi:MAG: amidohydrolase [Acidobacteria bacterium]|nr:amidohydrolase [Acidobacteriota bacterium]
MTTRAACWRAASAGALLLLLALPAAAQTRARPDAPAPGAALGARFDAATTAITGKVVTWRRDLHQHPELGNREFRTSKIVADHLTALGLEVKTGIAHTGVVGILRGGKPGKVVALRADMDALPVAEQVNLPFASKATAQWNGREVGVMHACGHDNHVSILMGVAEALASMKADLPGTVMFIFQPAEEGAPPGEEGGAELMLKEGIFDSPKPDAVFGLHVFPGPVGQVSYKPGALMASGDTFHIKVRGKQTHGAAPWAGVDPIVVASQIVLGLQTIVSRQVDITRAPVIVTVGRFQGGVRSNIVPDTVELEGTIRTFDEGVKKDVHARAKRTAEQIAAAAGATAEFVIEPGYPVTVNDPGLTEQMAPTLARVAGKDRVSIIPPTTTSEDFSYFQQRVPGLFFFLGVTPPSQDWRTAAANHSPLFEADEGALPVGMRALGHLTLDFLTAR